MAQPIIMPKTGMAMEEGLILEWRVKEGDRVVVGDIIAEIETDKSTMELESDFDGTVLRLLYEEGSTVPVTETIAWVGKPEEDIPAASAKVPPSSNRDVSLTESQEIRPSGKSAVAGTAADGKVRATPAARKAAAEGKLALDGITATGRRGEIRKSDVLSAAEIRATPPARRIADPQEVDLRGVRGSGHAGEIFADDLVRRPKENHRVPLTKIRRITGQRMLRSHQEIPVVSMDIRADVTELLGIRHRLNKKSDSHFTVNDFVLKAVSTALVKHPRLNSVLDNDEVVYQSEINLGMAVATDRGLVVPVIRRAEELMLGRLSAQAAELAGKAREGKLSPDDLDGGTFTISNIGKFGVTSFTPIINQPQAAILGVCAIEEVVKMTDGTVHTRSVMGLSLTFDHRIVDGAEAAVFFAGVRDLLESPLTLMV